MRRMKSAVQDFSDLDFGALTLSSKLMDGIGGVIL